MALFSQPMAPPDRGTLATFFLRIDVKGECWIWSGARNRDDYPLFRNNSAYRWSYAWFVGPIPDGMYLRPACGRSRCVNPAHRRLVSADATKRGQALLRVGECRRGHVLTPETVGRNTNAKGSHRICLACRELRYARWYAKSGRAYPLKLARRSDTVRGGASRCR